MSESVWTWVLFGFELIGVTGMYFIGRKFWWGWAIVLTHSIPWFIYSLQYGKPGFIAMSFLWWSINFLNMTKWFKEKRVAQKDMTNPKGLSQGLLQGLSQGQPSSHDVSNVIVKGFDETAYLLSSETTTQTISNVTIRINTTD
jgi:hypothetical protein